MKLGRSVAVAALAFGLLNWLPSGVTSCASAAQDAAEIEANCLRLKRDDRGQPQGLESAVVSYAPRDETRRLVVDLIAAVHIGDRAYYRQLNRLFASYDVLLYELVAPDQSTVPRRSAGGGGHPVSVLQRAMKSMLELEFQLEQIDYAKANFVHADMSPEDFSQSMKQRGESFVEIYFRAVGHAMAMQSQDPTGSSDVKLLTALLARDRSLQLKRVLAEQFESMGGMTFGLDGPEGSTILTERNKRALAVLADQIEAGRTRIGIFYGAAHMSDMQRRLISEFDLQKQQTRWIEAWDLAERPKN